MKQYNEYCNVYESLVLNGLKRDEEQIDLLELLIEDFDNRTINEIGISEELAPVELLTLLMQEHKLTKSQLARALNVSRQLITEIVNYKRNISKQMVLKLSEYFRVMPVAFTRPYDLNNNSEKISAT